MIYILSRAIVVLYLVAGCAFPSGDQLHSFDFDVRTENTDIEVLDYRYGGIKIGPTHAEKSYDALGQIRQHAGVTGYMPLAESLYVKWRIRASGEVREEEVKLKSLLPRNIEHQIITFNFKGGNLFVYLVSREVLTLGQKSDGPAKYSPYKVHTIYPDSRSNLQR